jgi:uncharacterized membrane protein YoaK (UPF0700 family)
MAQSPEYSTWPPAQRELVLILLATAGGSLDAIVMIGFGVMLAAQTGNTVILASALAKGHLVASLHSAMSLVGFIFGALTGKLLLLAQWPRYQNRPIIFNLTVELLLLLGLLSGWSVAGPNPSWAISALLIAIGAIAVGLQSAALLHIHAGAQTTYITGTLTRFTAKLVSHLQQKRSNAPQLEHEQNPSETLSSRQLPWVYGLAWLVYAIGALCGAVLFLRIGAPALFLPIMAIVAAIIVRAGSA